MSGEKDLSFEREAAEAAAAAEALERDAGKESGPGAYLHRLSKPLRWEGRSYESLAFRWDVLTGADHLDIENELLMRGKTLVVPEYTGDYLLGMAVRACTERNEKGLRVLDTAALKALPLKDFTAICKEARGFFAAQGVVAGDGGQWLREQCLILAQNNHTPAGYWASLPLAELRRWMKANNTVVERRMKQ